MGKTLRYLPEGKDFGTSAFDNSHVFTPSGHRPEVFCGGGKVGGKKGYANGGAVVTKNKSAGNPSTDPTSAAVAATNQAETDYRQSGGHGFAKGGLAKKAKPSRNAALLRAAQASRDVRMAQGGAVEPKAAPEPPLARRLFDRAVKGTPLGGAMDMVRRGTSSDPKERAKAEAEAKAVVEKQMQVRSAKKKFAKGGSVRKFALGGALSGVANPAQPSAAPAAAAPAMGMPAQGQGQGAQPQVEFPPNIQKAGLRLGKMAGKFLAKHYGLNPGAGAGGAPAMAKGMAKGGAVHGTDAAQDRNMVKKGVRQHESGMHKGAKPTKLKLNMGGMVDPQIGQGMMAPQNNGIQPVTVLRSGGAVRR